MDQQLVLSHMTPFAARFVIGVIRTPFPLKLNRPQNSADAKVDHYYDGQDGAGEASYVHITLSQRTLPLHASYTECEYRDDGYCELSAFLDALATLLQSAKYEFACIGQYGPETVTDGAPLRTRSDRPDEIFLPGKGMGTGPGSPERRSSDAWRE